VKKMRAVYRIIAFYHKCQMRTYWKSVMSLFRKQAKLQRANTNRCPVVALGSQPLCLPMTSSGWQSVYLYVQCGTVVVRLKTGVPQSATPFGFI